MDNPEDPSSRPAVDPVQLGAAAAQNLYPEFTSKGNEYAPGEPRVETAYSEPHEVKIRDDEILDLQAQNKMLAEQGGRDPLTGAYNRRFLQESYDGLSQVSDDERKTASESDSALSNHGMLVIDLDYFKKVNDSGGHKSGDDVLREITKIMQKNTRPRDVVARIGGDEFAVLLPRTSAEVTKMVADAIREESEELSPITVSIGVGQTDRNKTLDELIEQADTALYVAKQQGRNKVIYFGDLPVSAA